MLSQAISDKKTRHQSTAGTVSQKKKDHSESIESEQICPDAAAQHLQTGANNSPGVQQMKAYQQMANNSPGIRQLMAYQQMADNEARLNQPAQLQSGTNANGATAPVQRVKELDNGAKLLEPEDTVEKRKFLLEHIQRFEKLGKQSQADTLKEKLKEFPEIQEGEVLFQSVGPAQKPSVASALWAYSLTGPYFIFPTSYVESPEGNFNAILADGKFQFVITPEHPTEVLVGTEGHTALSKNRPVWFAGTVIFSGGQLQSWDNDTGHYKTTPEYNHQALKAPTDDLAEGILPLSKFVEYKM